MHEQMQFCIDSCYACATACDHCAVSCLNEKDVQNLARCIQLDMDCADICRLAGGYMGRGSDLASAICESCAQICDACAAECAKHNKMAHCKACEEACRRCAEECRKMVSSRPRQATTGRSSASASAH